MLPQGKDRLYATPEVLHECKADKAPCKSRLLDSQRKKCILIFVVSILPNKCHFHQIEERILLVATFQG